MSSEKLLVTTQNQVMTITLNRERVHNAFDDELIQQFIETLKEAATDDNIRLLCLKGKGKSFCAGADLNWMQQILNYTEEENIQDSLQLAELMHRLNHFNKPTLAVVHGATFGGGVGLVACCDIALASEEAIFCLSETKIGLIPAVISPYVIAAMGERAARRYFLTAERFSAATALQLGFIHEVVASDKLSAQASHYVDKLLNNAPNALKESKRLIHQVAGHPLDNHLIQQTAQWIATVRVSAEGQEGLLAFLEKRKPNWVIK